MCHDIRVLEEQRRIRGECGGYTKKIASKSSPKLLQQFLQPERTFAQQFTTLWYFGCLSYC